MGVARSLKQLFKRDHSISLPRVTTAIHQSLDGSSPRDCHAETLFGVGFLVPDYLATFHSSLFLERLTSQHNIIKL